MESYVRKTPFLELCGKYNSAVMALNDINFRNIDLLFLDIQMPDLNGLELSRMLPQDTRIVFTTAFDQYALDGFKVNALDYLLKPINYNEFLTASRKALEWFELKHTLHRRTERLSEDLYGKRPSPCPDTYQHEKYGGTPAVSPIHASTPLLHRTDEQSENIG